MTRGRKLVVVACVLLALTAWTFAASRQAHATDWQQSQSLGIRLAVAPSSAIDKPVSVTFAIVGPGLDGVQSRVDRTLEPGRFTYMFFPDDFHRKPLPGRYLWTCRMGDKVVAQGEFVFPSEQ